VAQASLYGKLQQTQLGPTQRTTSWLQQTAPTPPSPSRTQSDPGVLAKVTAASGLALMHSKRYKLVGACLHVSRGLTRCTACALRMGLEGSSQAACCSMPHAWRRFELVGMGGCACVAALLASWLRLGDPQA